MDCIFCKILNNQIPSIKVFENENIYAFQDINPKAPIHILIIHRVHTPTISDTPEDKAYIYADIFNAIREIADNLQLKNDGYRVIFNNGKAAGQMVYHVHAHLLAGKSDLGDLLPV